MDASGCEMAAKGGNTNPPSKRQSLAKRWCFTFNNYTDEDILDVKSVFKDKNVQYIVGHEIGENGTPHLQGYIESSKQIRPIEYFKLSKKIHWEKCKGDRKANITYCSKDENCFGTFKPVVKIKTINPIDFYPWQKNIVDLIENDPDDRSIYWYWESKGKVGKSAICKYLCVHHNAILLSGKAADMKYAIQQYIEINGTGPNIILIDIPRDSLRFLSYTGIEEIKNGCFFSGKYEGGMVLMNAPHIICFANQKPLIKKMSADRWNIINLGSDSDSEIDELDEIYSGYNTPTSND
jgi:hypothetical protein